jgi:hypothetical protein
MRGGLFHEHLPSPECIGDNGLAKFVHVRERRGFLVVSEFDGILDYR